MTKHKGLTPSSSKGFIPVLILMVILAVGIVGGVAYIKVKPKPVSTETSTPQFSTKDSSPTPSPQPTESNQLTPTSLPKSVTTPTPTPTTPHVIQASGFAYEDRNDNGIFDSDDPKIPYMELRFYDSVNPSEWIGTTYSETDGSFTSSLTVRGNLILQPNAGNNFRPRDASNRQYSKDTSGIAIGFRSASAPVTGNSGIIEGDTFNDTNRSNIRDAGEETIFFYKLYLQDNDNNYYNPVSDSWGGGHFKYTNLPLNKTYKLWLSPASHYEVSRTEYSYPLTDSNPTISNLEIPVVKVSD